MSPLPYTFAECGKPFWGNKTKRAYENIAIIFIQSPTAFAAFVFGRSGCIRKGVGTDNLPGWRWAAIKKVALDRLSRSLHSDVCDSDGCCDAVVHSTISGSGNRRTRAVPNISKEISNAQ